MTTYKLEANGKIERGHGPIVKPIIRAFERPVRKWAQLLPYALCVGRTTHSLMIGFMLVGLMYGQKLVMLIKEAIKS